MKKPTKPQKGDKVLQSLYNTVCDIIDYLPSLEVIGDNKTTSVNHSVGGTTIHAIPQHISINTSKSGEEYTSGRFIEITSGNEINCLLSGGTDIQIVNNVINYTGSGGGGGGNGHTYTGELNQYNSGFIWVDQSGSDPRLISSTLRYLTQLYNYPLTTNYHFLQTPDIKEGAGTEVNFHYDSIGNTVIDPQTGEEHLVKWIDGIEVDLNVSGGTYITTNFYHGVGYGDYSSASINCNLSGDRQVNHPYGLITIVPQYDASYNITGGIISTNLHAGTGIAIDPSTGEISLTGGTGGNVPTPTANTILSANSQGTMQWTANTGGTAGFAPDYSLLSTSEDAGMTTNGLGVTFLLPVNAGDTYSVQSTGPTVVCMYSPAVGTGESTPVQANSTLTAEVDGWVRVSVIDPGTSAGACVRFLVNGVPFANGLPLYKSRIMQNLTGDGDTIRVENGQIKCISTPPASSTADGTAVNSKTSFCFSPDIYYAEPNVTYFTSYKHDIDTEDDLAYTVDDLQWQFDTDNIDEGGDIIIALPEVDYPCMVRVTNFDNTYTTVVTQDGKYIVGDDGGAQGWASGQQSDKVGMNQTKIYVFQPTPIHWSSSYSGISAAINARDGVWWMQTFT